MEAFYEELNQWQKVTRNQRWSVYRSAVTEFVLQDMNEPNNHTYPSCLIIGAGGCEDVGLKYLIDAGLELTISDIDKKVMLEAVERDQLEGVKVQKTDYLGIAKHKALESYEALCRTGGGFGAFAECVESLIDDASIATWNCDEQYDLVICMPIYTQLFFFYMNELLYEGLTKELIDAETYSGIQQLLLEGMPKVIDRFNQNLMSQLKFEGKLIVFSDLIEDQKDGPYIEAFGDGAGVDQIVDAYVSEYGMGLGNYGLYNLDDYCDRVNQQWFLWPFDEERSMIVQGIRYKEKI